MINFDTQSGTTQWSTISAHGPYNTFALALIRQMEGEVPDIYLDTHNPPYPTIGIGYNLTVQAIQAEVLDVLQLVDLGGVGQDYRSQIEGLLVQNANLTNINNTLLQAYNDSASNRATFSLTATEITDLFPTVVDAGGYETQVDNWLSGIPASRERAVLLSLSFNQTLSDPLLGPSLKSAMQAGDRAEAWFEIRYRSNGGSGSGAPVAKRRLVESEIFGLYDNGLTPANVGEALLAYRMASKHANWISGYESSFGSAVALANGDLSVIGSFGSVQFMSDELTMGANSAFQILTEEYADVSAIAPGLSDVLQSAGYNGSLLNSTVEEIWVATDVQGPTRSGSSAEIAAHLIDRNGQPAKNDLIFGNIDPHLVPGLTNTGGADILNGGVGDDIMVVTEGGDIIDGGAGEDTVSFRAGIAAIHYDMATGSVSSGPLAGATITNVENVFGSDFDDTLIGDSADNVLLGHDGNDTLVGRGGDDILVGADGAQDTADYVLAAGAITVTVDSVAGQQGAPHTLSLVVSDDGDGGTDHLHSIERITGTFESDTVVVNSLNVSVNGIDFIDLGDNPSNQGDIVDVSGLQGSGGLAIDLRDLDNQTIQYLDGSGGVLHLKNVESVIGTGASDKVYGGGGQGASLDGGAGNDIIHAGFSLNSQIFGGAGDDEISGGGAGSVISGGTGDDTFNLAHGTLIADAETGDKAYLGQDLLTGGLRYHVASDDPWAYDAAKYIKYGLNQVGELVINTLFKHDYYIANYVGNGGEPNPSAGITVAELNESAYRILDPELPKANNGTAWLKDAIDVITKAYTGEPSHPGADPLALDLDGDGLELTAESAVAPSFDLDGDGFAERTGWVRPDDGLLVHDANANGLIDDIGELFGNQNEDGFAELATWDTNSDGIIDASDTGFASLQVWQDLDQDGVTDTGELSSLSSLGIESLSLASSAPAPGEELNAGNAILSVGTFTRTDQTTGVMSDVFFKTNEFRSTYLGDATTSAAADALPELKGHGELADLRIAMTQDPSLLSLAQTAAAANPTDLDALRAAVLPVLRAWGGAGSGSWADMHYKYRTEADGSRTVLDVVYTDSTTSLLTLQSGTTIVDGNGVPIATPTIGDIQAMTLNADEGWDLVDKQDLAFFEKYYGTMFDVNAPTTGAGAAAAIGDFVQTLLAAQNMLAVSFAAQGGLTSFFTGMSYDKDTELFTSSQPMQLVPVFEAIFTASPTGAAAAQTYLEDWQPIINVFLGTFSRGAGHLMTSFSYIFANLVAAFESIGSPLSITQIADAFNVEAVMDGTGATITGTGEPDVIYMNGANQTADGGLGHDVYVFGSNFGQDIVDDVEAAGGPQDGDMIRFATYTSSEISAARVGLDLILTVDATGDTVTVKDQFFGESPGLLGGNLFDDHGVKEITFADGVVWGAFEIAEAVVNPQAGDQEIFGTPTLDILDGGAGNDILHGLNDVDIYRFGVGSGQDIIREDADNILLEGPDFVEFGTGVAVSDVTFSRVGASEDLVISLAGTSDTLTIEGQFHAFETGSLGLQWLDRVENFVFEDGTYLDWTYVMDTIVANGKTSGDDAIYGYYYADTLDGGAGNDTLVGGNEGDTYMFGHGYGADTVDDGKDNVLSTSADRVLFTADVVPGDVSVSRVGSSNDLILTLDDGSTLTIVDQFTAFDTGPFGLQWFDQIETFEFQDGANTVWTAEDLMQRLLDEGKTTGDDSIYGYYRQDTIDGGAGNDYLNGAEMSDTYVFDRGYGHDTIEDSYGTALSDNTDKVQFATGILTSDITASRVGTSLDLVLTIGDTGETLTITNQNQRATIGSPVYEIEEFHFADTTVKTAADMRAEVVQNQSTSGNDTIYGYSFADVIDGGAGNDRMEGFGDGDTYKFDVGGGQDVIEDFQEHVSWNADDIIEFGAGITPASLSITRVGDDVVFAVDGTSDQLTVENIFNSSYYEIEQFTFTDSTVWSMDDVRDKTLIGTSGDDTLIGYHRVDTLDGGAGNDRLEGLGYGDTYVFDAGYGNDTIHDFITSLSYSGDDTVQFGSGIAPGDLSGVQSGDDLILSHSNGVDTLTVENYFVSTGYYKIEQFTFTDSTVWGDADITALLSQGGGGGGGGWGSYTPTITGTNGDDTLSGTSGADVILGDTGNDTMSGGAGSDVYLIASGHGNDTIAELGYSWDVDKIVFDNTVAMSDVTLTRSITDTYDLIVDIGTGGDSVLVDYHFLSSYSYSIEAIEFSDGTTWDSTQIKDMAWYRGTSGNDTFTGTSGDEHFDFGAGDDYMGGGAGSDIYHFSMGDGSDTIAESGYAWDSDRIVLDATILVADVSLSRSTTDANDLIVTIGTGGDTILVDDHFSSAATGVEQIVFDDGTTWDRTQIQSIADAVPPVVFDLDGDGVELVDASESGVDFDMDGDGVKERTGWIGADDAMLVLDRNRDGLITTGSEISFVSDLPGATSDLEGLVAFDLNGDGHLSTLDDSFGNFMIWQDANQNGISEANELSTLSDAGIASLDLNGVPTGQQIGGEGGNVILNTSTYTTDTGETGLLGDAVLGYLSEDGSGSVTIPPRRFTPEQQLNSLVDGDAIGHSPDRGLQGLLQAMSAFEARDLGSAELREMRKEARENGDHWQGAASYHVERVAGYLP